MKRPKATPSKEELRALERLERERQRISDQYKALGRDIVERRCPCQVGDKVRFLSGDVGVVLSRDFVDWPCPRIKVRYRKIKGKTVLRIPCYDNATQVAEVLEQRTELPKPKPRRSW